MVNGKIDVKRAAGMIEELGMLKFFPSSPLAQTGIVKLACSMAINEAQIAWLVSRMLGLYNEWPGPQEMRACFCSKFSPADGIEASSTVYHGADGIPSEKESAPRQIEAQPVRRLTAAEVTEDQHMRAAIGGLAGKRLK